MINDINKIKFQACNICDAMLRNINDNFLSVSFEMLNGGDVQVKFILEKQTKVEDNYIDDLVAELAALQSSNCVRIPQVEVGANKLPLKNIVYQKN